MAIMILKHHSARLFFKWLPFIHRVALLQTTIIFGLLSRGCLLMFAMISGGCTGSTSGGIKNLRLLIVARNIRNQFKQMLHPRAVLAVRVSQINIPVQTSAIVYTFLCDLFSLYLYRMDALDDVWSGVGGVDEYSYLCYWKRRSRTGRLRTAYSWAALPDAAKWILSVLMFIGRLEIFGILLLFYQGYWRDE